MNVNEIKKTGQFTCAVVTAWQKGRELTWLTQAGEWPWGRDRKHARGAGIPDETMLLASLHKAVIPLGP